VGPRKREGGIKKGRGGFPGTGPEKGKREEATTTGKGKVQWAQGGRANSAL